MTSVPKLHQRRPGNKQGTPARPHHRLIGHSCSSSRGGYISHASPTTSETLLHETEHLLALSFPFSQIAACDRPVPQEHPTDSLHWKEEREHSAQRSTHVDFSLVSLPSIVINPPSGGHLLSNPCRVIPHPVTLVENADILVKNPQQAISFTVPFLFFFCLSVYSVPVAQW